MTDDIGTDSTTTTPADDRRQLSDFIEGARWFGGKGRDGVVTDVRRIGMVAEKDPRGVVDLAEITYPDGDVEVYQVPTWAEHLRQHEGRLTVRDEEIEERAVSLARGPAEVTHLLPASD